MTAEGPEASIPAQKRQADPRLVRPASEIYAFHPIFGSVKEHLIDLHEGRAGVPARAADDRGVGAGLKLDEDRVVARIWRRQMGRLDLGYEVGVRLVLPSGVGF